MRELIEHIQRDTLPLEEASWSSVAGGAMLAGAMLLNPIQADALTVGHHPKHHQVAVQKEPSVPIEVRMLVGEAENQGLEGMRAVASAFRNLSKLYGHKSALNAAYGAKKDLHRFVNKKDKNGKDVKDEHGKVVKVKELPPMWVWKQAEQAWKDSASHDYANGANHWGTDGDVTKWQSQSWFRKATFIDKIGDHNLYKEPARVKHELVRN